ncbi:MAG: ABC transporter ATP-binding protein [Oscillospiraceae bacterium]
MATIWANAAPRDKARTIASVLVAILGVAMALVPYWGIYRLVSLFLQGTPTAGSVVYYCALCAAGYFGRILFHEISTTLSHRSAYSILKNLRVKIAEKLMRAPLGTVLSEPAGRIKNTLIDRVETIELPLAHMIPEGIANIVLPVFVFALMAFINWKLALAALVCLPIGAAVYAVMMRSFNRQYSDYMQASNRVNTTIVEYVDGIEVIKAFSQTASSYQKFTTAITDFKNYTLAWFRSTWGLMNLGAAILPATLLGLLPLGLYLFSTGSLTVENFVMCIILSLSLTDPISWFNRAVNYYKQVEYAVKDASLYLNLPELADSGEEQPLPGFDIAFNKVSFSYNSQGGRVLHNISLSVPQGSFTALVGPSGRGKTTIARLLSRFWDVEEGSVTIGGVDVRKISFDQLSGLISYVTQDNFLFNCSLFENIRMGKPLATDAEVLAAARAAQCEDFIARLEQGWNTPAGEAGKKLSGGEKQRISIARAILKNAPIVILDEATAFTDPENESKIQQSIGALSKNKTLVVIAHRLSSIQNASQIVVMEKGAVHACGTQQQLLSSCPLYQGMWQAHIGSKNWAVTSSGRKGGANA